MTDSAQPQASYYTAQYDIGAMSPDYPEVFDRWISESSHLRRTAGGLFDLAYGESPAERLDFFPAYGSNAPLMVFIHGGWWRSLDKSEFSFIAQAYTRAGISVALPNYSLAPKASIEEITLQNLKAVAWLYRHAEQYDFDRNRIVVAGHSAGAHLSAMMMAAVWPSFADDLPADLVKGGILLSGLYDLAPVLHAGDVNASLKLKPEDVPRLSPALMPQAHDAPFITAVGEKESDEFKRQNALIGAAWKINLVADLVLPALNHLSVCDAFASPETSLFEETVKLIARV